MSSEAQKQIKISEEVAVQLKEEGTTLKTMENVVNQCLNRDAGWKEYYRQKMDEITTTRPDNNYLDTALKERTAEINGQKGLEKKACGGAREFAIGFGRYGECLVSPTNGNISLSC